MHVGNVLISIKPGRCVNVPTLHPQRFPPTINTKQTATAVTYRLDLRYHETAWHGRSGAFLQNQRGREASFVLVLVDETVLGEVARADVHRRVRLLAAGEHELFPLLSALWVRGEAEQRAVAFAAQKTHHRSHNSELPRTLRQIRLGWAGPASSSSSSSFFLFFLFDGSDRSVFDQHSLVEPTRADS